jgi:hypothetical protein
VRDLKRISAAADRSLMAQLDAYVRSLLREERYGDPRNLNRFEQRVFSQSGEDGIIAEILRRIGPGTCTFLEIGSGDGLENNTALLLLRGWSGSWIDGNEGAVDRIKERLAHPLAEGRLKVACALVTAENVESILQGLGVPSDLDLLSLDVDRNTYWIWAALSLIRPRVAVLEYNANLPADVDWKVDYAADRPWNGTMYFGASLKALEVLGRDKGYCLVGCTLSGSNAFFVRQDLCTDKFEGPFTAERHYEPPRYFLVGDVVEKPRCFSDKA